MAFFIFGKCVPESAFGMGRSFRLRACWESASHFKSKFRVALSAKALNRKVHPIPSLNPGHSFRTRHQPESGDHSERRFWNTLSETPPIRKARPTPNTSRHKIISLLGLLSIKRHPPGRRARSSSRVPHAKKATSCGLRLAQDCRAGNFVPAAREGVSFRRWI